VSSLKTLDEKKENFSSFNIVWNKGLSLSASIWNSVPYAIREIIDNDPCAYFIMCVAFDLFIIDPSNASCRLVSHKLSINLCTNRALDVDLIFCLHLYAFLMEEMI
jgi:hypothetical protein